MPSKPRDTPIERIFRRVMGRKMSQPSKRSLHKSCTKSNDDPNVLDSRQHVPVGEREPRGGSAAFLWQKKKDAVQPKAEESYCLEAVPPTFVLSSIPRPI
jgi:hypothetical protein